MALNSAKVHPAHLFITPFRLKFFQDDSCDVIALHRVGCRFVPFLVHLSFQSLSERKFELFPRVWSADEEAKMGSAPFSLKIKFSQSKHNLNGPN